MITNERVGVGVFASFQMAFLQNRSISLVDMYIDNAEPTENVGQIHFSLEYDFQNTTLILRILTVSILKLFFSLKWCLLYSVLNLEDRN